MSSMSAVEINMFALLIVGIIYFTMRKRPGRSHTRHKLYMLLAAALVFLLAADTATRLLDGLPGAFLWNWALNMALFLLAPSVPILWVLYADYQVRHDRGRLKKLLLPLGIPLLLNAVLAVASVKTGWYFTIGADGFYRRGPLFALPTVLCYGYLAYTFLFIIANHKRIDKRHFTSLLIFPLPTALGGMLQFLFYGLALTWSSMSLSLLLAYLNIQDSRLDTDFLTGVYNRRLLDSYIRDRAQPGMAKKPFSAILIDLDHFKDINDTLGHTAGDRALTDTVALLKACLRSSDFVARFGGDEFLILLDIASTEALEETVRRLRECFRCFNEKQERPYSLSFSAGYDIYDGSDGMEPGDFIKHVDKLMYEEKKKISCAASHV